jgi:hypothetical protein
LDFHWDKDKKNNRRKHNISFVEASEIFRDKYILDLEDIEHSDQEERWISIGLSKKGKVILVVHTYKEDKDKKILRIISAREATKSETLQYFSRRPKNEKRI